MQNINLLDEFIMLLTTQLTYCNFDKAKDLCVRNCILFYI